MPALIEDGQPTRRPRHPEKVAKPASPRLDKPAWLKVRAPSSAAYFATRKIVEEGRLATVCSEAACPNIGECWSKKHATFMILGAVCTRACGFCNVATGKPAPVEPDEPARVAEAVAAMGLTHAVITSVDRDDLDDGGAGHFAAVIAAIRNRSPKTTIEVLTPDFMRKDGALETVLAAGPDVFNHNLETVPRLYLSIRPGARYYHSLRLLDRAKTLSPETVTKSGIMVGLGETREEVLQVMDDMRAAGVEFLTIGQYLQPTPKHAPIDRYWSPEEFENLRQSALGKGFAMAASSPFTRSSHHAEEGLAALRALGSRA